MSPFGMMKLSEPSEEASRQPAELSLARDDDVGSVLL
jgi:hypothetical protein